MKERPIIFSGPMVRAILKGLKTQTRRPIKPQHNVSDYRKIGVPEIGVKHRCPYGKPGEFLWVRETWADTHGKNGPMISYRAGGDRFLVDESYPVDYSRYPNCDFAMWWGDLRRGGLGNKWRPSIHMPRWASRITLQITAVQPARLQTITREEAIKEGIPAGAHGWHDDGSIMDERDLFAALWDSIYAKRGYGWDVNPGVWVIEFKRVDNGR